MSVFVAKDEPESRITWRSLQGCWITVYLVWVVVFVLWARTVHGDFAEAIPFMFFAIFPLAQVPSWVLARGTFGYELSSAFSMVSSVLMIAAGAIYYVGLVRIFERFVLGHYRTVGSRLPEPE